MHIVLDSSFPAFTVEDIYNDTSSTDGWKLEVKYNDRTVWEPFFSQTVGTDQVKFAAKPC